VTATSPAMSRNRDAKAERLISKNRCHPLALIPGKFWSGVIDGDSGCYLVTSVDDDTLRERVPSKTGAVPPRESCTCEGYHFQGACSHVEAAARLRRRSEPVEDIFRRLEA